MDMLDFDNPTTRRLTFLLVALSFLIGAGTGGYCLIEGWPFKDAFYMTVITISTVGYGETQELSEQGRWFTSGLIFCCVIVMTLWTATLTSLIVEGDLSGEYARRRKLKMISKLNGHIIVCGSDPMAQVVVEGLSRKRKQVVVIDDNEEQLDKIRKRFRKVFIIEGKATNELTLSEANILNANYVVAAMESEVDNLLLTIACKELKSGIAVYARSNDMTIANSMRKAGVDEVISPFKICGDRIADIVNTQAAEKKKAKSDADSPVAAGV